jgi:hypothetical protein
LDRLAKQFRLVVQNYKMSILPFVFPFSPFLFFLIFSFPISLFFPCSLSTLSLSHVPPHATFLHEDANEISECRPVVSPCGCGWDFSLPPVRFSKHPSAATSSAVRVVAATPNRRAVHHHLLADPSSSSPPGLSSPVHLPPPPPHRVRSPCLTAWVSLPSGADPASTRWGPPGSDES